MNCLKCGKETAETQVFCENCLKTMDDYPIKPGTPVNIPNRASLYNEKKLARKKETSSEDTIHHQRRLIKILLIAFGALALAFLVVFIYLLYTLGAWPFNT